MPTQRISPDSDELLQNVAQSLLKARKVVVVTGAGISTNSGIPDFRSENGLYSLIQAQFDAAARHGPPSTRSETDKSDDSEGAPPPKRRKLSSEPDVPSEKSDDSEPVRDVIEVCASDTIIVRPKSNPSPPTSRRVLRRRNSIHQSTGADDDSTLTTPQPRRRHPLSAPLLPTSPLSSPPPEDCVLSPEIMPSFDSSRLVNALLPSSPLSSPPAIIFEPSAPSSPSDGRTEDQGSTPPSEVDETPPSSNLFSASQTSHSGRTSLPNMKGKDLFDAQIWSDPLRTSVFYTFATTLRQKIKDVQPTSSHRFISHLRDRGKLVRCYTQNIDQIEEKVGLSTCLKDGPGVRGRFSRRSTANTAQLNKMVEEAANTPTEKLVDKPGEPDGGDASQSTSSQSQEESKPIRVEEETSASEQKAGAPSMKRETSRSGVECVFLHGSLEQLRCFLCGRVCSWDDADREVETLSGQQPECPHCAGATAARQERGKRALGVGKLRPDIVLYGEEHPNAHLISPIVTHDLALQPDMLLILGTSLRVHGLKVMVREFAKAVHNKGGKVVFVNFTKPPESSWGDIIDYWVEWDCDAWVANLQDRVPKLWQEPEPPKLRKKRESGGAVDESDKPETKKPPAAYPVAHRDTKAVAAYWVPRIIKDLHRVTGNLPPPPPTLPLPPGPTDRRASILADEAPEASIEVAGKPLPQGKDKPKAKRPRKSAPGALEKSKKPPSTLNPNHGRARRKTGTSLPEDKPEKPQASPPISKDAQLPPATSKEVQSSPAVSQQKSPAPVQDNSILMSVKSNPRVRKPKVIYEGEPVTPPIRKRRGGAAAAKGTATMALATEGGPSNSKAGLKLAPFQPQPANGPTSPYGKPQPLEPEPSRVVFCDSGNVAFKIEDMLRGLTPMSRNNSITLEMQQEYVAYGLPVLDTRSLGVAPNSMSPTTPVKAAEESAARALESLRNSSPVMTRTQQQPQQTQQSSSVSNGWLPLSNWIGRR